MTDTPLTPCCPRFIEQAGLKALAGGGFAYHESIRPRSQIQYDETEKVWNVNGCCGGGCHVITALVVCPWCGNRLPGTEPT